jgi:GDP-mannose 6-dehydrogenase
MKISIFGLGYVGCVSLGCLAKNGYQVIGVDTNPIKIEQINVGKPTIIEKDLDVIIKEQYDNGRIWATQDIQSTISQTDISIIAVGTPSTENGHLDLRYIYQVTEQIGKCLKSKDRFHIIAIRSTIEPGTCEKIEIEIEKESGKTINKDFAVMANPEFLREGSAVWDYFNPPYTLIGSENEEAAKKLAELYKNLPAEIIITERKVAEISKYVNNSFHALKIGFANEIGNVAKALGIDSHKVMDIFVRDKRLNISPAYLKPGFAYGGSCLPKDLKALQTLAHDNYLKLPILEQVDTSNQLQIERAIKLIMKYGKKKIGFLGLTFKEGTDDLRNSPAVQVVEFLLGKGYPVKIYDKNIIISRLTGRNKEYIEYHIPHIADLLLLSLSELAKECELFVVATHENEFHDFLLAEDSKPIIDLVRLGDQFLKKEAYSGINW